MRTPGAKRLALGALVALSLAYLLSPPVWMLVSSVSPDAELRRRPPRWLPLTPTTGHYRALFQLAGSDRRVLEQNPQVRAFPRSLGNSAIIALFVAWPKGWFYSAPGGGFEYPLMLFVIFLMILMRGGGRLALDRIIGWEV